jgi:hypothetical protein
MSEYGYIPDSGNIEQSAGNNKGIFTPKDIYNLDLASKWTSDKYGLVHIETITADGSTNSVTFNDIQNDVYRTQVFYTSGGATTNGQHLDMRLSADNGSSFISSANYSSISMYGNNKTVNTHSGGNSEVSMTYMVSSDNFGLHNNVTPATTVAYFYFTNWYDSNKYSSVTGGHLGFNTNDTSIYRAEVNKTLKLQASHNAFQVYANNPSYKIVSGTTMSLYGLEGYYE